MHFWSKKWSSVSACCLLFFIFFMFGMFLYYGYTPDIYTLQLLYYLLALSILVLGLSWITSSVVVFFRDMGQLVSMLIQFGLR